MPSGVRATTRLRESLRSLPSEHLPDSFAGQVAQRIGQLTSTAQENAAESDFAGDQRVNRAAGPALSSGVRRGLVWAAVTVAAAILLMVMSPLYDNGGRRMALVPSEKETSAAKEATASDDTAPVVPELASGSAGSEVATPALEPEQLRDRSLSANTERSSPSSTTLNDREQDANFAQSPAPRSAAPNADESNGYVGDSLELGQQPDNSLKYRFDAGDAPSSADWASKYGAFDSVLEVDVTAGELESVLTQLRREP